GEPLALDWCSYGSRQKRSFSDGRSIAASWKSFVPGIKGDTIDRGVRRSMWIGGRESRDRARAELHTPHLMGSVSSLDGQLRTCPLPSNQNDKTGNIFKVTLQGVVFSTPQKPYFLWTFECPITIQCPGLGDGRTAYEDVPDITDVFPFLSVLCTVTFDIKICRQSVLLKALIEELLGTEGNEIPDSATAELMALECSRPSYTIGTS
ncbi:13265_t:CDS:2, partial [Acaulospora colombiana]